MAGDLSCIDLYHTAMNTGSHDINFVFVLGIMPRSGTHYLANLLCLHPGCVPSAMPEDGLLAKSNMLMKYVAENQQQWEAEGDLPQIQADDLLAEGLGQGLLTFLKQARGRAIELDILPGPISGSGAGSQYMIAKTPSVLHLKNFFKLFPEEKLLILVRDGRSLVESINLSFGYNREEATRDWANAARRIFDMQKKWAAEGRQFLVVKYEDLYLDTEREMRNIFRFLGLDPEKYDFDKASNLPVVGSSVFKRDGSKVHWQPIDKTPEFDPMARTAAWTRWQHERFNWLAKNELILFGYVPETFKQDNPLIVIRNHACDFGYAVRLWAGRLRKLIYLIIQRLKLHYKHNGSNS